MTKIVADGRDQFEFDGVRYIAVPEHGAFFGVAWQDQGSSRKPPLLVIGMDQSGRAPAPLQDEHVVVVSLVDEGDDCLDFVNPLFGTDFVRGDFFGR